MERKENQIGKNVSSGAEKVESIAERAEQKAEGMAETKGVKKTSSSAKKAGKKPSEKQKAAAKAKREKEKAQKRVELALLKEKRKAKREENKAKRKEARQKREETRQKRAALAKERAKERQAERQARKDLLKSESKEQRAKRLEKERAAKAAAKKAAKERAYALKLERRDAKLKKREQKLRDKEHAREHRRAPGFGGWLAAVIALGATSLVLASVVTYGALDLSRTNAMMQAGYRGNLYELASIMDGVDNDLSKVRISSSAPEQQRLLTDLLVQARLAESSLEKIPLSVEQDGNVTAFINRTAALSNRLLEKLRGGETLSARDLERLNALYESNHAVRAALDELAYKTTEKDMKKLFQGKSENMLYESFRSLENLTAPENAEEAPFSGEKKREEKKQPEGDNTNVTSARAEELCRGYFKNYKIARVDYAGETVSRNVRAYNFFLTDEKGVKLFAEISDGGELVGFDYYEECKEKNFDAERALAIAEDYLSSIGYEDMIAVFASESGSSVHFKFAYEANGTVYYPDVVKVKVCLERGVVSGLDASAFLAHHKERTGATPTLTQSEAREKLNPALTVENARLAVIFLRGEELPVYEFVCSYGDEQYFVYLNAKTGEEESILLAEETTQGRYLR